MKRIWLNGKHRPLISCIGRGWSNAKWTSYFSTNGWEISDRGYDVLKQEEFNKKHLLEEGKRSVVALVSGHEIRKDWERTTEHLASLVTDKDYRASSDQRAELLFSFVTMQIDRRYKILPRFLREHPVDYVALLLKKEHTIPNSRDIPCILGINYRNNQRKIDAGHGSPLTTWLNPNGLFLIPVSPRTF